MKITDTLKEKSKEICSLSAYVIAATLVTSPLAFSALPFQPNQGIVNTKFRSTQQAAYACSSNTAVTSCFSAASSDEFFTGTSQGFVTISTYSPDYTSFISCSGSAYAGITSVNAGNGTTSIKATLNPADPSCYTDNWNAGIVMINLSGSYTNGDYRTSSNSKSTSSVNGTTYKYDSKYDEFQETFTGSITGLSGPWEGSVSTTRYTNRQQVK